MARVPMITRTVTSTKATVLVVDIITGATFDEEVEVARTYKDNDKLLKAIKSTFETAKEKIVAIKTTEEVETLYGMSEQKFIELAEKLPPRKAAELKHFEKYENEQN